MSVSATIADGKIQLSVAGFDSVRAQLEKLRTLSLQAFENFKSSKGIGSAFNFVSAGIKTAGQYLGTFGSAIGKVASIAGMFGGPFVSGFMFFFKATGMVVGKLMEMGEVAAKVITRLVAIADPVRFQVFAAHLTSTHIILGKMFIPLLQVAISAVEQFNGVLRGAASGGGFSTFVKHVAEILDRIVTALLPVFRSALEGIDKAFKRLIPDVDKFGDMLDPILDGIENMNLDGGGLVQGLIDAFEELVRAGLKLAVVFGPALAGWLAAAVRLVGQLASAVAGVFTVIGQMADVMKTVFQSVTDAIVAGINKVIDVLNAALDKVQGFVAKMPKWAQDKVGIGNVEPIDHIPDIDWNEKRNKDRGGGGTFSNQPVARPRVEMYGVEEAFKKAQQAAVVSPERIAEMERQRVAEEQLEVQRRIAENTTKKADAHDSF